MANANPAKACGTTRLAEHLFVNLERLSQHVAPTHLPECVRSLLGELEDKERGLPSLELLVVALREVGALGAWCFGVEGHGGVGRGMQIPAEQRSPLSLFAFHSLSLTTPTHSASFATTATTADTAADTTANTTADTTGISTNS